MDAMELKGLGVPLASSAAELEDLPALLVEDYGLLGAAMVEAEKWRNLTPRGNR